MFLLGQAVIQVWILRSQIVRFPDSELKIRVVFGRLLKSENRFSSFLKTGLVWMTVKTAVPGQNGQHQACGGRRSGRTGQNNRLKTHPEIGPPFSEN